MGNNTYVGSGKRGVIVRRICNYPVDFRIDGVDEGSPVTVSSRTSYRVEIFFSECKRHSDRTFGY